jgi:glutamate-1-semialdehyde 2,1-aminomutase
MLGIFFSEQDVNNFDDAKGCDLDMFAKFYAGMRENGIYIAPSQFEALFVSAAHTVEDIDETIRAAEVVLKDLRS